MAAKSDAERRKMEVGEAISSLYDLFPSIPSRGCGGVKTRATVQINKKIEKRQKELDREKDKDPELVKLKDELSKERKRVADTIGEKRSEIDAILRDFRLRGESEELLKRIEKIAATDRIVLLDNYSDCE